MHQYAVTFNFREPYQVLLDAQILHDAARFKMDLVGGLERTLQGKIKPMITQCSMRHLYAAEPKENALIEQAKKYERRRCNHHTLEEPLSALECFEGVVDPKSNHTNKHRYVVASQDSRVRAKMRQIPGVPLVYIHRSVMILEPMASVTEDLREREEMGKLRAGLKGRRVMDGGHKRKRDEGDHEVNVPHDSMQGQIGFMSETQPVAKKLKRGGKSPNPLSVKKPKGRSSQAIKPDILLKSTTAIDPAHGLAFQQYNNAEPGVSGGEETIRRKRKRKHKPRGDGEPISPVVETFGGH